MSVFCQSVIAVLLPLMLMGCGNKGPLVLPDTDDGSVGNNKIEQTERELTN